jgi:hypothetical protein
MRRILTPRPQRAQRDERGGSNDEWRMASEGGN